MKINCTARIRGGYAECQCLTSWNIRINSAYTFKRWEHRVGRVLSFFSSRRNWDSPTPHPQASAPPPLWFQGKGTLASGKGVGESQFRRGDIHCGTLYIYVLCGWEWNFAAILRVHMECTMHLHMYRRNQSPEKSLQCHSSALMFLHGNTRGLFKLQDLNLLCTTTWQMRGELWFMWIVE